MTGGRRTKEIMVYATSKPAALALLDAEFATYRRQRQITDANWKWMIKPAAKRGKITTEWRAYGRIEFI